MAYTTKIKFNRKSKSAATKRVQSTRRTYPTKGWKERFKNFKLSKLRSAKAKKIIYTSLGVFFVIVFVVGLYVLSWVQAITEELPDRDKPFGIKSSASEIYDRNGKLLYRVFDEANRDLVNIKDVPPLLKWAFLAAEDVDFYKHPGVDIPGLVRCGFRNVTSGGTACGASTITQQLIKLTVLTNERSIERKVKEVILALQIEKDRSKDEILEMYLNVAPEGSNIYGVKTAAKEYFDKDLSELNLAEIAILAAIPQNPSYLSPTKSGDREQSQKRVKDRQLYVLGQMEKYMDQINAGIKEQTGQENALTKEMLEEARNFELVYREPIFEIEAPHFVFYAQKLLQERGYNNGQPFTLAELETGGYKIYTTLDLDYQVIAEEQVKKGVNNYGSKYGGENAALVAMNPKNGEILAMVGSKGYFDKSVPEGCTSGIDCKFEPQVNITNTLQSPGSSMKPMVYYEAIMKGLITPGSILADVPIKIGPYEPKNYEGGFTGVHDARWMLSESRNIPAIYLVDQVGVGQYLEDMKTWGYTTLNNPGGYGPSVAVGGLDVKLIDHVQAYGVLANEGKFTKHEVILKIEDPNGNVIYEYQPVSEQVADPRGVYLVNHILNGKNGGPGDSWDGRDIAGKTGTSENQQETLFATYTPEIAVVGWVGNNNNAPMRYGASGFQVTRPWVAEFVKRVGGSVPATPFKRPAGIVVQGSCTTTAETGCEEYGGDLAIADIKVPSYVSIESAVVCTDQPNKLARDIDISLGLSQSVLFKVYKMPNSKLQGYLDSWIESKEGRPNAIPTEYCDINRNPSGGKEPWAVVTAPTAGQLITGTTLTVSFNGFSANGVITKAEIIFDGDLLAETTTLPYSDTLTIPAPAPGNHTLSIKLYDSSGATGTTNITLEALGVVEITNANPNPGTVGEEITVTYSYSGTKLDSAVLLVNGLEVGSCGANNCKWTPIVPGDFDVVVRGTRKGQTIESDPVNVKVDL